MFKSGNIFDLICVTVSDDSGDFKLIYISTDANCIGSVTNSCFLVINNSHLISDTDKENTCIGVE